MALAKSSVVAFLVILALWGVSFGAVYKVGDSAGWTTLGNIDYSKWAANKNFHVGDTLLFVYHKQIHNVEEVTEQNFQSCNATSPIASYTTGSDSITLKKPGHFYFLCGVPGHCQVGQKVSILVTRASTSPSASPSPAPSAGSPPSTVMAPNSGPNSTAPILQSSKLLLALHSLLLGLLIREVLY